MKSGEVEFGGGWVIIIAEVARASLLMMFAGGAVYKPTELVKIRSSSWSESGELLHILAAAAVTEIKLYPPLVSHFGNLNRG